MSPWIILRDARESALPRMRPAYATARLPASPSSVIMCRREGSAAGSVAARCGNRVQPGVAEHMRHEAERLEYFRERRVANAQTSGIGTERRHHRALAIARKTPPLHRTSASGDARLRMQMTGDFARRTGRLVTERNRADRNFMSDHAAEIGRQRGIVIAG